MMHFMCIHVIFHTDSSFHVLFFLVSKMRRQVGNSNEHTAGTVLPHGGSFSYSSTADRDAYAQAAADPALRAQARGRLSRPIDTGVSGTLPGGPSRLVLVLLCAACAQQTTISAGGATPRRLRGRQTSPNSQCSRPSNTLHILPSLMLIQLCLATALLPVTRNTFHQAQMLFCNAGKWLQSTKQANKGLSSKATQHISQPQIQIRVAQMRRTHTTTTRPLPQAAHALQRRGLHAIWLGMPQRTKHGSTVSPVAHKFPLPSRRRLPRAWRDKQRTSRSTQPGLPRRWPWPGDSVWHR